MGNYGFNAQGSGGNGNYTANRNAYAPSPYEQRLQSMASAQQALNYATNQQAQYGAMPQQLQNAQQIQNMPNAQYAVNNSANGAANPRFLNGFLSGYQGG